jgi:hypothetical protein
MVLHEKAGDPVGTASGTSSARFAVQNLLDQIVSTVERSKAGEPTVSRVPRFEDLKAMLQVYYEAGVKHSRVSLPAEVSP